MKIKAVIFDLDGTLLDTEEHILASFRHATKTVLGAAPPDNELKEMIGIPLEYQMKKLSAEHASELLETYREHNWASCGKLIKEFPGTVQTLTTLKEQGYRLAVVTSKHTTSALRDLDLFDYTKLFEFVQGADKTTLHKPNPEPLLAAAKALKLKAKHCAYVGDSPYDMEAARAAGMLAIAAPWGMFALNRLLDAGAEITANTITELPALL
ncbi:MAG: HAD-IA family hydrolase [Coriobacteriia bacterium]|nr:HAD-IA family hydrolase [Coriobacteriia bacterium]